MRLLGLDVGTKRIGLALSDELLITAQGLDSIYRKDLTKDLEAIKNIVEVSGVSEIIVGLPINMNGTCGQKAKEVVEFVDDLSRFVSVPVKTWDERLTTVQVNRVLLDADVSRAKRKRVADKLAAQVILQSYLDFRKKGSKADA